MAFEQFCLKWNNFQTNILSAFESLQSTEDLADVTLACDGTTIKAHKFILSACSPYFRNIFKENPCSHPVVILKDVHYEDLIALLNFMYHGEVMVTKEHLQPFLKTAEALQVSGFKSLPDLCHKITTKRVQDVDNAALPKRAKWCDEKEHDDHEEGVENRNQLIDRIKLEADDSLSSSPMSESQDNEDLHPRTTKDKLAKSLLESALEERDTARSILERSLTAKKNLEPMPRKPPEDGSTTKKDVEESSASEHTNTTNSNDSIAGPATSDATRPDAPAHHSSQCGTCPHCGMPFTNQSSLKYHVRLVHSELLNLYCCHLCPLTFGFRHGYKKHMADAHSVRS